MTGIVIQVGSGTLVVPEAALDVIRRHRDLDRELSSPGSRRYENRSWSLQL